MADQQPPPTPPTGSNPPGVVPPIDMTSWAAQINASIAAMNAQAQQLAADMAASFQPAPWAAQPTGPSDMEILRAIQTNPDLRKAVVGLMQAAQNPQPSAPG